MKHAKIIYLGSRCNKNCSYCDRDYIGSEIGHTRLDPKDIPDLINYIDSTDPHEDFYLGFHGGEPFLYIKQMSQIMDHFIETRKNPRFSILTNGTLIEKNVSFLKKYSSYLSISISYDFKDMLSYRGYDLDIYKVLDLLKTSNITVTQLQWVIPMEDRGVFDIEVIEHITNLYRNYDIGMFTLIPKRHIRGKSKFRNIMDEVDLQGFMRGFLQFIQVLYVLNINLSIDGHSHSIDKDYFNNHKQIVLAPNGDMYPEFDFLDYNVKQAVLGNWKEDWLDKNRKWKEMELSPKICWDCSQFKNCGIKYLNHLFDKTPGNKCEEFYTLLEAIVEHYGRLRKYNNLIEAVH